MGILFKILIITLPALILSIIVIIDMRLEEKYFSKYWIGITSILAFFCITISLTPFVYEINNIYGIIHCSISYISVLIVFFGRYTKYKGDVGRFFFSIISSVFLFITAVSISIIPQIINIVFPTKQVIEQSLNYNVNILEKDLIKLKNELDTLKLYQAKENVAKSIKKYQVDYEIAIEKLSILQLERSKLQREIEYYEKLISVNKEQAELIMRELNKGKGFDYLFGYLIGLASSFTFYLIVRFLEKKKNIMNQNY